MYQQKKGYINLIADYDADDYDYRTHWKNRAYEQWSESYALRHFFESIGQVKWLIDFGGGFGRNAIHYSRQADHAVIVDYSFSNLERAATTYAREVESGRLFLIRADLYHLPFIDGAFDMGLTIRVLHHLVKIEDALQEMGRVVGQQWLLDIPIKHHIFALVRALSCGKTDELTSGRHKILESDDTPYASFHLAQMRYVLTQNGWDNHIVASVNNFRRWDQLLPGGITASLRPFVYGIEIIAQRIGKGWWGPSQFLFATRNQPRLPQTSVREQDAQGVTSWKDLAMKVVCPVCRTPLNWDPDEAYCEHCAVLYPRRGVVWDFVPQKDTSLIKCFIPGS